MNDVVIDVPALSPEIAAQLADWHAARPVLCARSARHRIGRIVRAFLPGAAASRCWRASDGRRSARWQPRQPDGLFVGPRRMARALSAAHPLARRGAGNRGSLRLRPAARRARPVLFTEGRHSNWPFTLGANADDDRRRARRALRRLGAERARGVGGRRLQHLGPRRHPMRLRYPSGVWELFVPRLGPGAALQIRDRRRRTAAACRCKADPLAQRDRGAARHRLRRRRPAAASLARRRLDAAARRRATPPTRRCRSTKCMPRPGSGRTADGTPTWDELAERLVPYVGRDGLHPCRADAGHGASVRRLLGLSAARPVRAVRPVRPARGLRALRRCAAIAPGSASSSTGCPAHFPTDAHGLARFDGTALYEHADPREGFHQDWNTCIYNFGRREVQRLPDRQRALLAGAFPRRRAARRCGRLDALPRLRRKQGEWIPTSTAAARISKRSTSCASSTRVVARALPRRDDDRRGIDRLARRVARRSATAASASPTNGTWAGCTTRCATWSRTRCTGAGITTSMTFGLIYAFSENFVLPLSHDEVVYGKGSLIGKMPGDDWQTLRQSARLFRLHVGASRQEAAVHGRRDRARRRMEPRRRDRLGSAAMTRAIAACSGWCATSTRSTRSEPRAASARRRSDGFRWVIGDDRAQLVFAFLRYGDDDARAGAGGLQHDAGAAARLPHRRAAGRARGANCSTPMPTIYGGIEHGQRRRASPCRCSATAGAVARTGATARCI